MDPLYIIDKRDRHIDSKQVWEVLHTKCTYLDQKLGVHGIRRATITPYYSPGNSIVENFNRSLQRYLATMENQYDHDFVEKLRMPFFLAWILILLIQQIREEALERILHTYQDELSKPRVVSDIKVGDLVFKALSPRGE